MQNTTTAYKEIIKWSKLRLETNRYKTHMMETSVYDSDVKVDTYATITFHKRAEKKTDFRPP